MKLSLPLLKRDYVKLNWRPLKLVQRDPVISRIIGSGWKWKADNWGDVKEKRPHLPRPKTSCHPGAASETNHSSAGLQLPTAPLGHGPCPAVGPHLGRASDSLCPRGGAWSTRAAPCLQLPGSGDLCTTCSIVLKEHRFGSVQFWCGLYLALRAGETGCCFLLQGAFFAFPNC